MYKDIKFGDLVIYDYSNSLDYDPRFSKKVNQLSNDLNIFDYEEYHGHLGIVVNVLDTLVTTICWDDHVKSENPRTVWRDNANLIKLTNDIEIIKEMGRFKKYYEDYKRIAN